MNAPKRATAMRAAVRDNPASKSSNGMVSKPTNLSSQFNGMKSNFIEDSSPKLEQGIAMRPLPQRTPGQLPYTGQLSNSSIAIPVSNRAIVSAASAQIQKSVEQQIALQSSFEYAQQLDLMDDNGTPLPMDTDFKWAQENYSKAIRTIDTWTFILNARLQLALLDQKWSYIGGFSEEKKSQRTRVLASYVRESILELGPTFIKLGQLSSTRSDLFPKEFTQELSKLQDRVPAFSLEKAIDIIERELGKPLGAMFSDFETRPIAAASLGQVHRARLRTGEEVVVKVQRPGLKKLFDIDLDNLRILSEQLDKQDENNDFTGIYQECAEILYQEIDYIREGRSADRFRRNFKEYPWVRAPKIYWKYTTTRVIVQEYLPGVKISDKEKLSRMGLDVNNIALRATESYLIQILKHGFFHADPHPGNVSVDADGRLVYYDFGMMGEIQQGIRDNLLQIFYGIYRKDVNAVTKCLVQLEIVKPNSDLLSIKRSIKYFIDNINRQAQEQETLSNIGEDLFAIAIDQPFRFPATFTFVLRAFSTLEGVGKTLNEDYNFAEVAKPYAQELLNLQDLQSQQFALQALQTRAREVSTATVAMPERISYMEQLLRDIDSGEYKLRVRVLEAERANRRASIMQNVTLNSIGVAGAANMAVVLAGSAPTWVPMGLFHVAGIFGAFVVVQLRRVKRLDEFEKKLRG